MSKVNRGVERIKRDTDRLSVWALPADTLAKMAERLQQRMGELAEEMRSTDAALSQAVTAGDAVRMKDLRGDVELLFREWEQTRGELQRVETAHRERRARDRLAALLGGERGVLALDLLVLALIVGVVVMLTMELFLPMDEQTLNTLVGVDTAICLVFLAEFFLRWHCAEWKAWFLRRHWLDFLSSLPYAGLLRYGRLARVARLARLARLIKMVRILLFLWRGMDKIASAFNVPTLRKSLFALAFFFVLGGGAIYVLEKPHVGSPGDGVWWSFATVVTGGFADLYNPQTVTGRVLTALLILLGILVTGVFTASLASVFVGDDTQRVEYRQRRLEEQIVALRQQVETLTGRLAQSSRKSETLRPSDTGGPQHEP
jgi:voltage-gated potassium channel